MSDVDRLPENCHPELVSGSCWLEHAVKNEIPKRVRNDRICTYGTNSGSSLIPRAQVGKSEFYSKRTPKDSELDINKSIKDQFNLLRICNNEQFPAFFCYIRK